MGDWNTISKPGSDYVVEMDFMFIEKARFERMRAVLAAHQNAIDEHELDPPGESVDTWGGRQLAAMRAHQDAWDALQRGDLDPIP